jgi:hypothetical protein
MEKESIILKLKQRAFTRKLFWSYDVADASLVPDELLIERTLQYGDLTDLKMLFQAYPSEKLQQIWEEKLVIQERDFRNNLFLADIYFHILEPESYLTAIIRQHRLIHATP